MTIEIPEMALVLLIGPSSSGKSTLARKLFQPAEILSSDAFRALVSNDENALDATGDAFDSLHFVLERRLARGLLTVVDATNVQPEARKAMLHRARKYHIMPVALVMDLPLKTLIERNEKRTDRNNMSSNVVRRHHKQLKSSLSQLKHEGFRYVFTFESEEQVEAAQLVRQQLWNNKKDVHGPFDLIGDVHGCYKELVTLLGRLGYAIDETNVARHPEGRQLVFVGDLVDRGPGVVEVIRLVMRSVEAGTAHCVCGNHDNKLARWMDKRPVKINHGLQDSIDQLTVCSEPEREQFKTFLSGLISHYVFDDGKLVVAHAGLIESMHGRGSAAVREFCMYGETTGEIDEFGLPVRLNWALNYKGKAMVVYGHTPIPEPEWLNNTLNIDTGCVFGGQLTALRYPERVMASVPAEAVYCEHVRPIAPPKAEAVNDNRHINQISVADVLGKQIIETQVLGNVTLSEGQTAAAFEIYNRFGLPARWLVYLPPTMSPVATSKLPDYLEYPDDAFAYYRENGVNQVICEQKHMGSRAVLVLCQSAEVAAKRFGATDGRIGVIYTRTGRPFFPKPEEERLFLNELAKAAEAANLWETLQSDWVCIDGELTPWNAKAQGLLVQQYAPTAAAGIATVQANVDALLQAQANGVPVEEQLALQQARLQALHDYRTAYLGFCLPYQSPLDLRFCPFHLLAAEGQTFFDRPHTFHLETLHTLVNDATKVVAPTEFRIVSLENPEQIAETTKWWLDLTASGGEGFVVKPMDFMVKGAKGLIQPAVKCRGREYLRIIYGPDYTMPHQMARLKNRNLGTKRQLALREFALGVEGLTRLSQRAHLSNVFQCVMGVLALETEPVDPRL